MINKDVTHIVITIMAVVSAFLILALFFMPLAFLRVHIIVATVMMTLALGLPALNAFAALSSYKNASEDLAKVVAVSALVIGALLATVTFIFILNPKATYKIYLDKSVDDYGNEVFIRPRFIPVAFNEWWSILTYIVSPLPLLLISFI